MPPAVLRDLLESAIGADRTECALAVLDLAYAPEEPDPAQVSRATVAIVLTTVLFSDLLQRVPTASAYVDTVAASGESVCFDHGAMRTVAGPTGALPSGSAAFTRILEPLGYAFAHAYPLPRLRMQGASYTYRDLPYGLPQFFLSELQADLLGAEAQEAAVRVFGASHDPLEETERTLLGALSRDGSCPAGVARAGLPGLARAFGVNHPTPTLADYETLRADSTEAAWIATEGNRFNHATTRVADVAGLADRLRAEGWPIKEQLEVSGNGRVIQTAFIADKVMRPFRDPNGNLVEREVPGSFYEFIERRSDPATGKIDLTFDTANATGIFAVTSGA